MPKSTYKAMVTLANGQWQEVTVEADNSFNATAMLEAQYGRGSVVGGAPFSVSTPKPSEMSSLVERGMVAASAIGAFLVSRERNTVWRTGNRCRLRAAGTCSLAMGDVARRGYWSGGVYLGRVKARAQIKLGHYPPWRSAGPSFKFGVKSTNHSHSGPT
jgi:hypothetical protein